MESNYRTQQQNVHAFHFTDEMKDIVLLQLQELQQNIFHGFYNGDPVIKIPFEEGSYLIVKIGSWIVRNPFGDWGTFSEEDFKRTFEPLSPSPTPQVQSGLSALQYIDKHETYFVEEIYNRQEAVVLKQDALTAMEEYAASKVAEKEREITELKSELEFMRKIHKDEFQKPLDKPISLK